jgi:hypothetical protein
MPPAVIGAIIGATVALCAVFLTSYLSSRADVDKKLLELHVKLLEDMLTAISTDSTNPPLDARVQLHSPDLSRRWQTYWVNRVIVSGRVGDDYSTKLLIKDIQSHMRRPLPGTLRKRYGSVAACLTFLIILETIRIAGLAYPTMSKTQDIDTLYKIIPPLDFERALGTWVRGLRPESFGN